jgi:lipoprotein NlpI
MTISIAVVAALGVIGPGDAASLQKAADAFRRGDAVQALVLVDEAIRQDPAAAPAHLLRGVIRDSLGKHADALGDLDRAITLAPQTPDAYQQRGCVNFKLGKFDASVRDFDRYIELRPEARASHWQRGISYYYAERYDDGRKQFEGYQDYDSNDVENAVWRFMCMARGDGLPKARQALLKIGDDRRVPMRQVYDLFKGELTPKDVLTAAQADTGNATRNNSQHFYAHLYVGIYHDLTGERQLALEHLNRATDEHRIGHYMWDVARVHRDLLKAKAK